MVKADIQKITDRIIERSKKTRESYLARIDQAIVEGPHRSVLSCGNLAHGFAACPVAEKSDLSENKKANLAIVSSYNDMLSAHQPFERFPALIKEAAREAGAVAQFAGGVPAMCDGVTQGQPGMELSLFSRDVIAMSAAIGLSHNMFDAALYLGVCDKIIPGLMIGALTFGHLPAIFVPAGPMPSGLPNDEKSKRRQLYALGKIGRKELLETESASYHSPGTCTFYGTANSNQFMMEVMGLHVPGSTFVHPNTELRDAMTKTAAKRAVEISQQGESFRPIGKMIDERSFVNAIVALLATGGSTNHTLHLIAMGKAAGIQINWDDFSDLSAVVPLVTRIYPNGLADVNHFDAAGGVGFVIQDLVKEGILHGDVQTIWGDKGLHGYDQSPYLNEGQVYWRDLPEESLDTEVLRSAKDPFQKTGGLALLSGNLGRSVIKVSAVKPENRVVEAPAQVFSSQAAFQAAFAAGDLHCDHVAVVRFQGPQANGMPELHKLTPPLSILQDLGYNVALVTDGRMSGASGKVPAAIHVTPESALGGPLAKIRNGDLVRVDANTGVLSALVEEEEWKSRPLEKLEDHQNTYGMGRELFLGLRQGSSTAEEGASFFHLDGASQKGGKA